MRILVTGATGFIGRHLLLNLKHTQHNCCAVIRNPGVKIEGAKEYLRLASYNEDSLKKLPSDFDAVIHLADGLSAFNMNTEITSRKDLDNKIQHTINIATWAKENNVRDFIYISSDKAMGIETEGDLFGADNQIKIQDTYAAAKRYSEMQLTRIFEHTPTRLIILRNPIVHGPGCKSEISKLLELADSSWLKPLRKLDSYSNTVSVINCCDAIKTTLDTPDAPGGIYLIADDGEISSDEIIKLFRQELGKKDRLSTIPKWFWTKATSFMGRKLKRHGNHAGNTISNQLFRKNFGWLPAQTKKQSLQHMARQYANQDK